MRKSRIGTYQATILAIARAVNGEPKVADVIAQEDVMQHPLAATFEERCITLKVFPTISHRGWVGSVRNYYIA